MNQVQAIYNAILAHPLRSFLGYYVFSNLVLYMPPPEPQAGVAYKWLFGFLHGIAGALPRVAANFLPPGSWLYKLLSGGNGETNGAAIPPNPNAVQTKVDILPPPSSEKPR